MKFTKVLVAGSALIMALSCARVSTVGGCPLQPYANCAGKDLSGQLYVLRGLDLNHINLNGAKLEGSDLTGTILSDADLTNVSVDGNTILKGADLSRATLANETWNAAVDATSAKLIGATVSGSKFTKVNFTGADFTNATISCSEFIGGSLNQAIENGAKINSTTYDATITRVGIVTNSDTEQCLVAVAGNVQFLPVGSCATFASTCKSTFCPQITDKTQCGITQSQCQWNVTACAAGP